MSATRTAPSEDRALLYLIPALVLVYAYCPSHRRRASALLAFIASVVAVLAFGFVLLMPKAASVLAP